MDKITKYNGEQADRKDCRRIRKNFYEKNIDCFRVGGLWRGVDNPIIVKNLDRKNTYILKTEMEGTISGRRKFHTYVIGKSDKGTDLIGFSCGIPFNIVEVFNEELGNIERVRTSNFDRSGFLRDENNGIFYKESIGNNPVEGSVGLLYKREFYNFDKIQGLYSDVEFKFNPIRKSKYSFGIEIETDGGRIPATKLNDLGLFPLKDGSISGYEYTSVPFNDVGHAVDIAKTVSKYCSISIRDSLHVHVGGIKTDKESISVMYEVLYSLQDEIYSMFPQYKKGDSQIKNRAYSDKLPKLSRKDMSAESHFNELMMFFTDGKMNGDNYTGEVLDHPQDPNGEHKWQIGARYKLFNLIPMVFSDSRTMESRIHEETTNPYKIAYWIMINEAIVDFAQKVKFKDAVNHKNTLKLIVSKYFKKDVSDALLNYIDERKLTYKDIGTNDMDAYARISSLDKKYEPEIKLF